MSEGSLPAILEDSADDLYEHAPCGNLSTLLDGTIAKINTTLLNWLGYQREELVGIRRFSDLLTVGGKLYHETHFAPLLQMQGEIGGVALELRARDGSRLPVLVSSIVKTGPDGQPLLIRTTVFDARDRRAYEQELLRARQDAERDQERLQHIVATLQRSLLPAALPTPPGVETAAYYHMASADEVGGDFYDLFETRAGCWCVVLGDVSGKGVEAATATALARHTIRAEATQAHSPSPAAVLLRLNEALLAADSADGRFLSAMCAMFAIRADGTLAGMLCSAGHPPGLLRDADGAVSPIGAMGTILGAFPEPELVDVPLRLGPGDSLVLYTDGVIEARPAGTAIVFGEDRLHHLLADSAGFGPQATIDLIVTAATAHVAGPASDDIALIVLRVPGRGQ